MKPLKEEIRDQGAHALVTIAVAALAQPAMFGAFAIALGLWAVREHAEPDPMTSKGSLRDLSGYIIGAAIYTGTQML